MSSNPTFNSLADTCYRLDLSDGNRWFLGGHKKAVPWLDAFARITKLIRGSTDDPESESVPMLLFTESAIRPAGSDKNYPNVPELVHKDQWKRWDGQSVNIWYHEHQPDVICEIALKYVERFRYVNMWDALHPIYQKSMMGGGLPFHAGLVEREGKAYLLPGPGDTGKSTCCRRVRPPWKPLCDDEALVVLDPNGVYRVHPFPTWSDYIMRDIPNTWDVQYSVPLGGIFFLEQSETNEVVPLNQAGTAALINNAAVQVWRKFLYRSDDAVKRDISIKLFDNACRMAKQIPGFLLRVSLEGRFWEKMEDVI